MAPRVTSTFSSVFETPRGGRRTPSFFRPCEEGSAGLAVTDFDPWWVVKPAAALPLPPLFFFRFVVFRSGEFNGQGSVQGHSVWRLDALVQALFAIHLFQNRDS